MGKLELECLAVVLTLYCTTQSFDVQPALQPLKESGSVVDGMVCMVVESRNLHFPQITQDFLLKVHRVCFERMRRKNIEIHG